MDGLKMKNLAFGAPDYLLLAFIVVFSMGIGLYHAVTGGRQKTMSEYLVGNRQMRVLPVALSLLVTFQSAVLMVGMPAEMYVHGTMFWLFVLSAISANVISAIFIVPLFHPLKLTSAYEYLQLRFKSRFVRMMGSAIGILGNTWYCGVVMYAPSIILEAVSGTPVWTSIILLAAVAIVYTSIGGYKAVIWTDVFQFLVMFTGMIAIIIKGLIAVDGFGEMWRVADEGGRIKFFNFNPDPTVRNTFWCLVIGGTIKKFGYNLSQSAIQRMSSMETVGQAQGMVLLGIPGFVLFGTLACLEGLLAYAFFAKSGCDPLEANIIKSSNQIIPYFVMVLFQNYPGIPGLFLSSVLCASLSSLSSNLNGISAMVSEDFVKPFAPGMTEMRRTLIAKLTVLIFGCISVGVSFLASHARGPLYQIASLLLSSFGGALTGLFLVGALFSSVNAKGAIAGTLFGFGFCFWVSLGGAFSTVIPKTPYLPSSGIQKCSTLLNHTVIEGANSSFVSMTTPHYYSPVSMTTANGSVVALKNVINQPDLIGTEDLHISPILKLYSISYMWLYMLGVIVTVLIGLFISFLTGGNKGVTVDSIYIIPVVSKLCCCFQTKSSKANRVCAPLSCSTPPESYASQWEKDSSAQMLSFIKSPSLVTELAGVS